MHRRQLASLTPILLLGALACTAAPREAARPQPAALGAAEVAALAELMQHEDTRTFDVAALERLFAAPSPVIRARTVLAAGRIGDRAATPLLLRGLTDATDSVRTYAAFALGELADSSAAVVQALGVASAGSGAPAAEALAALGKLGLNEARPYIEQALRARKAGSELQEALLASWRLPRQPSTTALVRAHARSGDRETRWRAVYALTRGGPDPANVPAFVQWLRDDDHRVRSLAARGLRAVTADSASMRPAATAALAGLLADPEPHVRISALAVLATYRDSTLAAQAAPLLRDADRNVRIAAAQALGLLGGSAATVGLATSAADAAEPAAVRGSALVALAAVAPARAAELARELAQAGDPLLRIYAGRAFAATRSVAFLPQLRALARDPDARVQTQAVQAVAAIAGDSLAQARTFFIQELAAASPYVRAAALSGLQRLAQPGDEAIVMEAFEFALRDSVEEAAVAALAVLARLAEASPAITRSFSTRFPLDRIPLPVVKRTAVRQLRLPDACCALPSRPAEYERVIVSLLLPALQGKPLPRVRVVTARGAFELELLAADAPLTVDNFLRLARRGYYDGGRWHRVVPNFVLQDGDPSGTGSGGPGYAIRDEINRVRYGRGVLGMALSGPDTGGSQFFITHSPQPHLDGGYTVFGHVVSGLEIADQIIQDDAIVRIEVIE